MSHSGIPVVEQIGQAGAAIGDAVGGLINPKPPAPPVAPTVTATPTDPTASAAIQTATAAQDTKSATRGQAANMLADDENNASSLSANTKSARTVLLGS